MASFAVLPNVQGPRPAREPGATKNAAPAGFGGELAKQLGARATAGAEAEPMRTPLKGSEAAAALSTAWRQVTGQTPNPKLLSVLTAQWSHETGRGAAMLNYNFGGLKGTSPSGLYAAYKTHEGSGETSHVVTDRFRAYRTAAEGAADYVRFLRERFPTAIDAAQTGDANAFVHELKRSGYFTDNEQSYARSVSDLALRAERDGFDSIGAPGNPPRPPTLPASVGSIDSASYGLAIAPPSVDSGALADEIAQAAMRIAHSSPEDYLNEIERLDSRTAT
jgi:hypothetical protein